MQPLRRLSRKPALWIGFVAVLAPLLVLLAFQYRWLASLQEKSAIAQRATLENYLEAVITEIRYHYSSLAERGLNVPRSFVDGDGRLDEVERYFRSRPVPAARWLFLVYHGADGRARAVFFDPGCSCWGEPPAELVRAVHVSAAPWVMLAQQRTILGSSGLQVDERNPDSRVILNPLTDRDRRVVGIAGMVLDPDYFRERVLPAAIDKALPQFFTENPLTHFMVRVEDSGGELKYSTDCPEEEGELTSLMAATKPFSFVFQDWGVAVQSHGATAEEWARDNFMLNVSLSLMLGVVLIGGTVFTLRTASREFRLSQMKSDFVSNVSHELRTPLASIQAFGEILRRGKVRDAEKAKEYGNYIETESRRLGQLISNLLDFSRIENGERAYAFERVDLATVVGDVLGPFEIRAREEGFTLRFENRAAGPLVVLADREALAQALTNLLDNALKYSGESRSIEVWVETAEGNARVAVRDHGVGISFEERDKIFE
ncbi:MAG: histidine kinase dimerization/phospho-acceptor domain-containing protein, partial [Thermoanaerobaculia bacterium]|nr:histidine kinase dimerization/phospho-acceptor domain-containing protein [Thermoanaerobaculia bacterium]